MKLIRNLVLAAVITATAACSEKEAVPLECGIVVNVCAEAVRSMEKNSFESRISSLDCLLFKDDTLSRQKHMSNAEDISFIGLAEGDYRVVILTGDSPEISRGTPYEELVGGEYYIYASCNGYSDGFHMFGQKEFKLLMGETKEVKVTLSHCCSRLDIASLDIEYSWALEKMNVEKVELEEVFVLNAMNACHVDGTPVGEDEWGRNGVGSFNSWNGSGMDFSTNQAELDATYYSYNGEFTPLYITPTKGSDAPCTSFLVLKTSALFKDSTRKTWYYRIRLDKYSFETEADREYSFDLTVIGPGADTPLEESPGIVVNTLWEEGFTENDSF